MKITVLGKKFTLRKEAQMIYEAIGILAVVVLAHQLFVGLCHIIVAIAK
mgnify:CR=1 FL=1